MGIERFMTLKIRNGVKKSGTHLGRRGLSALATWKVRHNDLAIGR